MTRLNQIRLPIDQEARLEAVVAEALEVPLSDLAAIRIIKRALDARHKSDPVYVYTVDAYLEGDPLPSARTPLPRRSLKGSPPVIVGTGPAGLFAALRLADYGIPSILFDRGAKIQPRTSRITRFWKHGALDPESNVCFGEGGAGLFSDGKLNTRIRSPYIRYVLERLVDFGAPEEILYVSNPHVGSDRLRRVLKKMVCYLEEQGCALHLETRVDRLLLDSSRRVEGIVLHDGRQIQADRVLLAPGHSARDLYRTLHEQGVALEAKSFAMGVRIEHPQDLIDRIRLGKFGARLGPAEYRVTYNRGEVSAYSFCMCPGGYVLSSSTEPDGIVINGMSNYRRNTRWANAALVVPIEAGALPGESPFRALELQRRVEKKAFEAASEAGATRELPAQRLKDFLADRPSTSLPPVSSPSSAVPVHLPEILPDFVSVALREAIIDFDRKLQGFITDDAVLMAVESRTSAPIRIARDPATLESVNTPGLLPIGEGAGYAGGITSSAVDGIRAVEVLLAGTEG